MDINHIGLLFNEYTHQADYLFTIKIHILISVIYLNIKQ